MDVNHNLDDDAVNADESSKAMVNDKSVNGDLLQKGIDPAPKNEPSVKANKTSLERRQHPSLKLRAATGPFKPKVKSQTNPAQVLTDISKTTSKDPAKSPSRRERESTLRTSTEKSSVKTDIRTTRTVQRTPILEDSRNQKAKFVHDNKSGEKESMRMKAGESQPSSLKAETRRYQPLHRLSCPVNSTKADTS
ncbi:uncharacterized protein LOC121258051 isoform X2 [Juglans microcarpa x Juglans regia]|uniref:uncharacterized protein LOC121258051 isoform X2 n=1 Tax=Juglans microcarpa x Juglans regia TaxID=2249226 RepID=UPI001B7E4C6C|nr:uncharacterized protein LOC121258051 isoform X2 [Juglans microcarpa x Juglans regia]